MADYLRRFLSDPAICPINPRLWHFILNRFIIPKRAPVSAEKYASIWTEAGSPLDVYMKRLIEKLKASSLKDKIASISYATSYSFPTILEALSECKELECDQIIVIPLYPQSAFSTTGAVRNKVNEALKELGWTVSLRFIENYYNEPLYIEAIAHSIEASDFDPEKGDKLLFVFHSIPVVDIRGGDTYGKQTQSSVQKVVDALNLEEDCWKIGYQCRFDKSRKWLGPFAVTLLDDFSDANRLFTIAPNFSVDCLETLYDIEIMLRKAWSDKDVNSSEKSFQYISCLNDSSAQVELIRKIVLDTFNR